MTRTETILDEEREHRGHYIRVRVRATPPLPHDADAGDDSQIAATVELYDGPPLGDLVVKDCGGDLIYKTETAVGTNETRSKTADLISRAMDRVDARVEQRDIVATKAETAIDDMLGGDGDD